MPDFTAHSQPAGPDAPRVPSLTERITEILTGPLEGNGQDRIYLNFNGYRPSRSVAASFTNLLAQAAEEHYRPRIETVEQLDALPVGSVLADLDCDLTPPPVYVRFIDGWSLDGLKVKPGRRNLTILWSPGAGE